jgi:hypothetical protein
MSPRPRSTTRWFRWDRRCSISAHRCSGGVLHKGFPERPIIQITRDKFGNPIEEENIIDLIKTHGANFDILIKTFNNKNKINAICNIWENRHNFCSEYYTQKLLTDRLNYLQKLPHIGKITANHLARNLGEDVVKYDIWIQRLGCLFAQKPELSAQINNANLNCDIKTACDNMFTHLYNETKLPRGYIDVVLWKSLQQGLIKL